MRERIYLSIMVGPTPREAVPILATEDPTVVEAALEAIRRRLGAQEWPVVRGSDQERPL